MHLAADPRNPLKSRNIYPRNDEAGDLCSAKCNRETEGRSEARVVVDELIDQLNSSSDHRGLPYFLRTRAAISARPDEKARDGLAAGELARQHGATRWS
jgi:hypothetical protein